jgi:ATP-binding cassette subfamily F protein 3
MPQVQADRLWKAFGPEPLLRDVSLTVRAGDRVGLVGPNGCGKTTLLKILAGESDPDRGEVRRQTGLRIGFLKQNFVGDPDRSVWDLAQSAFGDVMAWTAEADRLAREIAENPDPQEHDALARQFDRLQAQIHQADGYQLSHRIERVLDGLGFAAAQWKQAIGELSGGQINRLMLAHLLLSAPDVMLLDEPSNHLDLAATEWLETFLVDAACSYIVISHDRYLLDKVSDRTLELIDGTLEAFPGNYTQYQKLKQDRLQVQRRTYERQQLEVERLKEFVRRNHYGQKATQAEDRRRKLERIELVERPREVPAPAMSFPPAARCGDIVVRARRLTKSFDRTLFEDVDFQLERGQRWGILGPNGCGKTTLLRCVVDSDFDFQGSIVLGAGVRAAYFDQHLDCVGSDDAPIDAIRSQHRELTDQERRDLLARFGITGDVAFQRISTLSGGQRSRVALARLAASQANLMVMDEPTNHLDLWSREALAAALAAFEGTLLLVSHDRYFLNQICDHLLVFEEGRLRIIDGNYDTFLMLRSEAKSAKGLAHAQAPSPNRSLTPAGKSKWKYPYRKLESIESDIEECEAIIAQLHRDLSNPEVLRDGERTVDATRRLASENDRIERLYEHWQEASQRQ